jgi:hypothetical protein
MTGPKTTKLDESRAARAAQWAESLAQAKARHNVHLNAIRANLQRLLDFVEAQSEIDAPHWGNVGTVTEIDEKLAHIVSFAYGEEE